VNFSWSYSRLKNYETCPKRHYHYDIAKDITEPETFAMSEGHAVHKALELRISKNKALPLGMGQYEKTMKKLAELPGEIYAEQKLAITKDFEPVAFFGTGVWFRTVIDFCAIKGKSAAVLDYKTGRPQTDLTQLELMSATILHHQPQVDRVQARLMFLNHDRSEKAEYTREELPGIWSGVLPRVKRLQKAMTEKEFPPKPNGLCVRYCAVSRCPYWGKGSAP
jgi:RecB family exonuclease